MGNQQSRGNQSDLHIDHKKITKATIFKSKNKEALQLQVSTDQKNYDSWKKRLSNIQPQKYSYLMIPQDHNYSGSGLCSSSGSAKLTYQNYPYLLDDQIQKINKKKSTFSECQIWKLLLSIVNAKKQYWEISPNKSSRLGDIRPKNIFLNQKGDVKLINGLSWPNQTDNYGKFFHNQASYLAPQDLQKIQLGVTKNPQNQNSQIFSIGMTLLSVGLAQNFQKLYDLNKHQIDKQMFKKKILEWKTTLYYSEILRAMVVNMLQFFPQKRLSFQELDTFLQPHSFNINGMKPLIIQNAPKKLEKQINDLKRELPIIIQQRFQQSGRSHLTKKTLESVVNLNPRNPSLSSNLISPRNDSKLSQLSSGIPIIPVSPKHKNSYVSFNNGQIVNPVVQQVHQKPHIQNFFIKKESSPLNQIAVRLVQEQNIQHADSLVDQASDKAQNNGSRMILPLHTAIVNQVSPKETNENHLYQKLQAKPEPLKNQKLEADAHKDQQRFVTTIPHFKQPQQSELKENLEYLTYADAIINAPYDRCWDQFLKVLEDPAAYSQKYSGLVKAEKINNEHIIIAGNAKVKVQLSIQEGKAHFTNVQGSEGSGEILGGVSRAQNGLSQIWFNSAFKYNGQIFPGVQEFENLLEQMNKKLCK